jgi:hypothetical protein
MNDDKIKDKGGRRQKDDRRTGVSFASIPEKRKGLDRRGGRDRRDVEDPVIRITEDERREAFRDIV